MKSTSGAAKSWFILIAALSALAVSLGNEIRQFTLAQKAERDEIKARLDLPQTADLFSVTHADLAREHGKLVVYTDGHAKQAFNGRYKVALRDRSTFRHAWTPEWSGWIDYAANPDGTRYRQPETLEWWANYPSTVVIDPLQGWFMETCWQARVEDKVLGWVELEPVCIASAIEPERIEN
jgi:hypothetical protein